MFPPEVSLTEALSGMRKSTIILVFLLATGLWCNGGRCLGSACSPDVLLDESTVATLGVVPSCTWKDKRTVRVMFGTGELLHTLP